MENGIDAHLSDDFAWDPTMFRSNVGVSSVSQFLDDLERDGCDENEVHPSLVEVVHTNLSDLLNAPIKISAVKHDFKPEMDAEKLADLWFISIENAARTLKCVNMDRIRKLKGKIHKRFKTKAHQKRYKQLGGYLAMFASDTFKSNVISLRGNKYVQLFCNRGNYVASYPIKKSLMHFMHLSVFCTR